MMASTFPCSDKSTCPLPSVYPSVGKDLMLRWTPTLGLGATWGGCAYRFTTYRESDFADHDGQFGLPLHHPRFLGAPEYVRLLGRNPSEWIRSLSRWQTIDSHLATRPLQHDACLMTSNLNILGQYVLCLSGDGFENTGASGGASWLSVHSYGFSRAGTPCVQYIHSHGGYGPVAPSTGSWCPSGPDYSRPSCLQTIIARLAAGSCSSGYGLPSAGLSWILNCYHVVYISLVTIRLDINF